jgi:hypothetical protein
MSKILFFFSLILALTLMTACSSTRVNKNDTGVQVDIPLVVRPDVSIGDKQVTGSSTVHSLFWLFSWGDSKKADYDRSVEMEGLDDVKIFSIFLPEFMMVRCSKQSALYDATVSSDSDMLLSPRYTINSLNLWVYRKVNCNVKGFPAKVNRLTPVN